MSTINRGDFVYVAYQPGDKPNILRTWPQVNDRNVVGSAPEGSAMLVLKAPTVPVIVGGRRVNYSNPYPLSGDGIKWWYVRSFLGDANAASGQVINAWTAQNGPINGQWKQFLEPLASRAYACDQPGQPPRKSYLAAGKQAYVTASRLPLLRGPGGGYEVLATLALGTTLTVLGAPECDSHGRLWWRTDRNGWVCETEPVDRGIRLNLAPLTV